MLVWRLQNSDGRGPYNSRHNVHGDLIDAHQDAEKWPVPLNDGIPKTHYDEQPSGFWVCGFVSKQALNKWFDGWLPRLRQEGFSIVKFKVNISDVCRGKKQLTFLQSAATMVSK